MNFMKLIEGKMINKFICFLSVYIFSGLLNGCTGLVSGSHPIPVKVTDYGEVQKISDIANNAPLITTPLDNRPVKIYKVAFDGTLNDRTRVLPDERETLVARIATIIQADNYYPGAGMQGKNISYADASTGESSIAIAEDAREKFFLQARLWLKEDPNTEIRVFVTGFSRGAATARQFINITGTQWDSNFNSNSKVFSIKTPRFYALLYDTVATGQQDRLALNIPPTVDYLVHFVATDETRNWLFVPTVDEDMTPLPVGSVFAGNRTMAPPRRINTVYLPGAHSDIGASYSDGIGDLYITLTEQFLYMMGLTKTNCWESSKDPLLAGKHDSRGMLDVLFGSQNPSTSKVVNRPPILKKSSPLTLDEQNNIAYRLNEMWKANFIRMSGMYVSRTETSLASITLKKSPKGIIPLAVSNNIYPDSLMLSLDGNSLRLRFRFVMGQAENSLLLTPKTIKRITSEGSEIAFSFLESTTAIYIATWVDNQLVELSQGKVISNNVFHIPSKTCVKQLNGTFLSPIRSFVIGYIPNAPSKDWNQ